MVRIPHRHFRAILSLTVTVFLTALLPALAGGAEANRLLRIRITPRAGFTRVAFVFTDHPDYTLSTLPGRVRITVRGADAPSFKRYRAYTDARLAGVFCSQRGSDLQVVVRLKPDAEARLSSFANPEAISLDVAPAVRRERKVDIMPGRERILEGSEKLVREFGTPFRSGIPFTPSDPRRLEQLVTQQEALFFQRGEDLLYKEECGDAIAVLSYFLNKEPAVRALASYRLGQAYYLLDRNDEALKAFREGERIEPTYLERAPEVMEAYAEVRARTGDFAGGRALLSRLIAREAAGVYAGPLMNHLAAMLSRHGDEEASIATFRNVMARFPGSSAAARAKMKLLDREVLAVSPESYQPLKKRYQELYDSPGDNSFRDEALFKVVLLESLYGPAHDALELAVTYQRRYPRGIFVAVVKKMREELLLPVYREVFGKHDPKKLVQLAVDHKEYLSVALADPDFARRLGDACHAADLLTTELSLFGYFADRPWAGPSAPYMLQRLVEDAHSLGKLETALEAGRAFLSRFPKAPRQQRIREELGAIAFEKGDLKGAAAQLSFLNGKNAKAELVESDYYLGKGLLAAGDRRGGERALSRFAKAATGGSPLLPDTYFSLGAARAALNDANGAIAAYSEGLKFASGATADQFLYKMGELYLKLNRVKEATAAWEKVTRQGKDASWKKMAAERLEDLKWRIGISRELPARSKN